MDAPSPELLVAVYDDDGRAARAARELAVAEERGLIGVLAVAVVARDPRGRGRWSVRGGGVGHLGARAETIATVIGVLLPADLVVGGLLLAADAADADAGEEFAERFAHAVADALAPGTSALVGVIEERWATEVEKGLRGYHRLTRGGAAPC